MLCFFTDFVNMNWQIFTKRHLYVYILHKYMRIHIYIHFLSEANIRCVFLTDFVNMNWRLSEANIGCFPTKDMQTPPPQKWPS